MTSDEQFDTVIVGGGLAGSAAAAVLAGRGFAVLVLERETAFRDRVRGEWLASWGVLELEGLGLRHVADGVPHANVISRHVSYDESVSAEEAEQSALDIAGLIPGGGCLALGHPQFQDAMLAHAATLGATVRRGVDSVEMTPGLAPTVAYRHDGRAHEASCRIVLACDGRESPIRRALSVELRSTPPQVNMAGMLIDGSHDWPAAEQAAGVEDDFHYLIFPQTGGRVRLYGAWDASDSHRFSGQGRERRFLDAFRLTCLPAADVIADATPVGPLAGYPMTDSWTDIVATEGVVLVGDAAGWSDPIIGQGMSVVFRDVRMITDVMTCSSDWSPAAFDGYAQERRERMRRLRFASAGNYLINGFGPDAIARRRRLRDMFAADPSTSPLATVLLGAWVLPEEAYSPEAWAKLLAA